MERIGGNLKRFRLLKNLSLVKAGEILGMSSTAIAKYERGELVPNSKKLIEFAKAYGVKVIDILSFYKKPELKFLSFRKKSRLKGEKLDLLKEIISNEVAKYLEVIELNNDGNKKLSLKIYDCNSIEEVETITEEFRKKVLMINDIYPISDLTSVLENLGILLVYLDNPNGIFDDFDGLSEVVNGIPVIVTLKIEDGARQRFTLAHELGHLILNIKDKNLNEEKVCDRFASALLMPKKAMIQDYGETRKTITFYELNAFKEEFKVSYAAIAYRLKDLKIISEHFHRNISIFLRQKIGKKDPNPINVEKSYQFEKTVYKLETSDVISVNKACELLGLTADEYNKQAYYN